MEQLTVAAAAAVVGVSPGRIRQLIDSGELAAEKVGRDWVLRRSVVERFAAKDRPGPGRPRIKTLGSQVGGPTIAAGLRSKARAKR